MAGNLTENFSELCRLCASKISLLLGINIFQGEGSAREISKKISTCLPIQVLETDRLPKMICNECVYKLDVCFQFHEKCRDTENLFVELMNEIKEPKSMNIQIVQSSQEMLDHSNISLPQLTTNRENIMVGENIILNDNIAMHNHELDNIEISPHELNSHEITHPQQLDLHHGLVSEMQIAETHLNVQNLDLIHSQHSLISNYEPTNNGNCVGSDILMKEQRESVKVETVKSETQNELIIKTMYSDASETESSDSELETSGEKNDPIDLIHDNVYEDQNEYILSTNETEVGTSEDVETNQYYCNVCGKAISGKEEYLDHYGEHLNKCLLCDEDFSNLDELKTHRQETHSSSSVKIEQSSSNSVRNCLKKDSLDNNFFKEESSDDEKSQEAFMNENDEEDDVDDLEDNNKNTKRKRWEPKVCKECGKTYKTNYKLAEHMRKHTGEQPFKCSMCDKAFRSKIGLAQHEAKHTGNYDYSCPTCGKGFQCKSYLIVHQRVHSNLKPYPCSQCGRNFKTKQSLLDHMNRHLGVKPFMCEICGRSFITKGLCKSHQKVHSGRDNRQFPCTVCNKLFVSKSYLNTHLRIHTGEKPFMCEVCGKGFLTRVDLRIHSTMHTGEKSFVCEICGKAFARRDALRCHRRSHTGERPYRCDVCGQTFTQFSPMAIHKRLHTGERPYTCEICKKSFVSRSTMMSHRKKHVP